MYHVTISNIWVEIGQFDHLNGENMVTSGGVVDFHEIDIFEILGLSSFE